jgi:prevent-host-death family protein
VGSRVSVARAKAEFANLVRRAETGERIIIVRAGKPIACLGPFSKPERVVFGDLRGLYVADDLNIPDEIIDEFYRKRS